MITRRSIVEQIEILTSGGVGVRMALQLLEDGKVVASKWHRTMIPVGVSPAEQLAFVNDHLGRLGEAVISSADIQRVGLFHKLACDLPSEYMMSKSIDETVAEIKAAKASTEVDTK